MSTTVHNVAKEGFGTGNDLYDRARPSYQPNALAHIRQAIKGSPPLNVVELGSGTGIFTRALLANPDWASSIKELRAIEPSEGMRSVFSKTVTDPRVSTREGTFDTTGVEDGWADLIVIAQAFHWCPDYDKACAEFARVLKPNGIVAFIWNLEDRNRAAWVAQLRDRIEKHEQGSPQFRLGLWRAAFSTPSYQANFEPQEENVWDYILPGTRDIVVERACSKSYITVLSPQDRQKVIEDIEAILQRKEGLNWIDESKGVFEYPYQTFLVIAKKK
ncbi:S-adenosyl-L-methionine-dependent methyltransferase [Lentinus tigrinus ALCF2SS1-7]|uniref:S-adenosyl-L-methionine-dependent methyltransferase n=1 Tax=Lentinus tigrinus ALCF2SS1-6 TaxID=1328759 RepID=A0A5C2SQS2_9APHY|nr:S-adenosyl-L-methionine-dependent methyltransferase [Lentinus tigrinus ALCF2SS1-6]RPD80143.1 S-adenosyl-L-methionine-dependent methyltransferase [Lentinus tigrinus ALCF2SS1-7]